MLVRGLLNLELVGKVTAKEVDTMKSYLVEVLLRPEASDKLALMLDSLGVTDLTITRVEGAGRQRGHTEIFRGREYDFAPRPKVRLEFIVQEREELDGLLRSIRDQLFTGRVGDGKVFVHEVEVPEVKPELSGCEVQ